MLAKLPCQLMIIALLFGAMAYSQTPVTVTLEPSQDNTISPDDNPERSGGADENFFSGAAGGGQNNGRLFRALLQFDLSEIAQGTQITDASLVLNANRVNNSNAATNYSLFRLTNSWGEGTSNPAGNGGALAPAETDDVTWSNRFFGQDTPWNTPGGDFNSSPSATVNIDQEEFYTFSSTELLADIQAWVDDPNMNFGWILISENENSGSAVRFGSRENPGAGIRPQLMVTFVTPNNSPVVNDQTFSISENSINNTIVDTVDASDPEMDMLSFSISGGNTDDAFAIDQSSGIINVNNASVQDFETNPSFALTVDVSDGTSTASATITINLENVNEAPVVADQTFQIEESIMNGAEVGLVVADDPEDADLNFVISPDTIFMIDNASGILSIVNASALTAMSSFELTVEVSDAEFTTDAQIIINVDADDPPVIEAQTFEILEGTANGSEVGTIVATDPEGTPVTLNILSGNTNDAFALEGTTGVITVNDASQLDFDVNPSFALEVEAMDAFGLTSSATITINILEDVISGLPEFEPQSLSIFPNPIQDRVILRFNNLDETEFTLNVFDIQGKLLISENLNLLNDGDEFALNTSGLQQGIYLMNISSSDNASTFRLIKR